MQLAAVPAWVSLSGQMAPIASFVVSMSPLPTIQKIKKDKNVGSMPLLPYSSMTVNCFVWMVYGECSCRKDTAILDICLE